MPLIVVVSSLKILMLVVGAVSGLLFLYLLGRLIFAPAFKVYADRQSPPPEEGWGHEIVLDDSNRFKTVAIGQIDSQFKMRMVGIKENHIKLLFRKEAGDENYLITIVPRGTVFYLHPHSKHLEVLEQEVSIESHELIGHPARIRLVALMKDHRALHYLEFELSTQYFMTAGGTEKMKFILKLKKIYPAVNRSIRNKKGIYAFGRGIQTDTEAKEI